MEVLYLDLLKNKTGIVTGAGSGIGREIATLFARKGADIMVADKVNSKARQVAEEINNLGYNAIAAEIDVSDWSKVDLMVAETIKKFGKIDILVNNAGIQIKKPLVEFSEEEWDRVINVNLKGVFLCIKRVIPEMKKIKKGKIINIASVCAFGGELNAPAYCASKGGVVSLTKELALELAPIGINVNAICPGAVNTPMLRSFEQKFPGSIRACIERTPAGRLGTPKDVARVALFLASDTSEFINGASIVVDGGVTSRVW